MKPLTTPEPPPMPTDGDVWPPALEPSMVERLSMLEQEVTALRAEVRAIAERGAPVGWRGNNYTHIREPAVSMCSRADTGTWSVWRGGERIGPEAATPETAAQRCAATRR